MDPSKPTVGMCRSNDCLCCFFLAAPFRGSSPCENVDVGRGESGFDGLAGYDDEWRGDSEGATGSAPDEWFRKSGPGAVSSAEPSSGWEDDEDEPAGVVMASRY